MDKIQKIADEIYQKTSKLKSPKWIKLVELFDDDVEKFLKEQKIPEDALNPVFFTVATGKIKSFVIELKKQYDRYLQKQYRD